MYFRETTAAKQIIAYAEDRGLDPEPILQKAENYCKPHNISLVEAFSWYETEEGVEYWSTIERCSPR